MNYETMCLIYTSDRESRSLNTKYQYMTSVDYNPSSARFFIQPDLPATREE